MLSQGLSSGFEGVVCLVETWEIHLVGNVRCSLAVTAAGARTWTIVAETTTILRVAVAIRSTTATASCTSPSTTADVSTTTSRVVSKTDVDIQQVLLLSMTFIIFLQ